MFTISQNNNQIKINEVELEKPIINESKGYVDEMKYCIDELDKSEVLSLITYVDSKPAGYIFTYKQEIDDKIIFNIDGILVAKKFQKKGIAQKMINDLIKKAKKIENYKGIYVEMDTTKYAANKLLLKMGFEFAGTKFFIYKNEKPSKYSKEAMYFYYKIN